MSREKVIRSPVRDSVSKSAFSLWSGERESTRKEQLSDVKSALRDVKAIRDCIDRVSGELENGAEKSSDEIAHLLRTIQQIIDENITPVITYSASCEEARIASVGSKRG
jgi:hypothetical protein